MSASSFAEILRKQIEKSSKKAFHSTSTQAVHSATLSSAESLDVLTLHQRLFEQDPNAFSLAQPKIAETPYRRFTNVRAKKVHTKANVASEEAPKPIPRVKGVPHKLNEKQKVSMTYFINEKIFLLEDFTSDELKRAYRLLALAKHPDRQNGSAHHFIELKRHFEVLKTVFN